jgi:6-phosphogluconolactonase
MEGLMHFSDRESAVQALYERMALIIHQACLSHGSASVLLSGGSTPLPVYEKLFQSTQDFSRTLFGLVDDRFVPINHPSSNEGNLRNLFKHRTDVQFVGMVSDPENYAGSIEHCAVNYQPFHHGTMAILGMGNDGHFASLFPSDEPSVEGLTTEHPGIIGTNAPSDPKQRISTNLPFLLSFQHRILFITGEDKLVKLEQSKKEHTPITYIFDQLTEIYYAP